MDRLDGRGIAITSGAGDIGAARGAALYGPGRHRSESHPGVGGANGGRATCWDE
jgi:hypothetical protein